MVTVVPVISTMAVWRLLPASSGVVSLPRLVGLEFTTPDSNS